MRKLLCIFIVLSQALGAQGKLYFTNGTKKTGVLVSMGKDIVYFKNSDTSATQKIAKSDLLLIENYKGTRYIFDHASLTKKSEEAPAAGPLKRNAFGMQPFGILLGRATFAYERLSEDGKIGLVLPFSLTFDPFGTIYKPSVDTSLRPANKISGVSFIAGADLNFYFGKERSKFFLGPRIRYGNDLLLNKVEAYSVQTQIGWKFSGPKNTISQHLSVGFGYAQVLSIPGGYYLRFPKRNYGWFSLNYRVNFNW